jgi:hypothetical protein
VNLVISVPTAIVALRLLRNQAQADRPRIDLPGVAAASAGLFALVYGFSNAETSSWSDPVTIAALASSAVMLSAFVLLERRAKHPLLPLHIVWDRARGGAYASIVLVGSAVFAVFLFLTFYMQQNLAYTPLQTGLGFLPMSGTIVLTATTVQTRILPRTGAKPIVTVGMTIGIIAMLLLTRLTPHGSYAGQVLPGLVLTGLAMGCIFAPAFSTATLGVRPTEAGIASAMVNTSQQVGGSVGTALLSTIFASAVASYLTAHTKTVGLATAAAIHGYTTAFEYAAGLFGLGLLVALIILPSDGAARTRAAQVEAHADVAVGLESM